MILDRGYLLDIANVIRGYAFESSQEDIDQMGAIFAKQGFLEVESDKHQTIKLTIIDPSPNDQIVQCEIGPARCKT